MKVLMGCSQAIIDQIKPKLSTNQIESVKGFLYYCYGPHYGNGVVHTMGLCQCCHFRVLPYIDIR